MHTLHKQTLAFAAALSMLAGYVDAIGFLQLGGYFISFMSGNSTRLAIGLKWGDAHLVGLTAEILLFFVAGATAGTLIGYRGKPSGRTVSVLALVTALLGAGALCPLLGLSLPAILLMTFAMGAANAALQGAGDTVIGVTYMTGTLVKIGQRLGYGLLGGEKFTWVPYLLLWLGLVTGGVIGAFLYGLMGLHGLWVATLWAGGLTIIAWKKK